MISKLTCLHSLEKQDKHTLQETLYIGFLHVLYQSVHQIEAEVVVRARCHKFLEDAQDVVHTSLHSLRRLLDVGLTQS